MKKYVCTVCGWSIVADKKPEKCPVCNVTTFNEFDIEENTSDKNWACEHEIGVARDVDKEVLEGLRAHFLGECSEVGMYLAMSRQAEREGYPEIADAFKRYAYDEADHASRIAEMLGEVVTNSTKENLQMRVDAEHGACQGKLDIATRAKQLNYDAIHDSIHEMAKDEARHGKGFEGLLKRYFK